MSETACEPYCPSRHTVAVGQYPGAGRLRAAGACAVAAAVVASIALFAPACSKRAPRSRVTLAVFAASSLTDAFYDLERAFEAAHPEIDVALTFAGSQVLRLQIEQGAPADVFASANASHLSTLAKADLVAEQVLFAHNELVVIVPRERTPNGSSLATIGAFRDLPQAERVVIGLRNVPVGIYTREMLQRAASQIDPGFVSQVKAKVVSEESNVRLVRAKVELGEADAAIVYRSDAAASDSVAVIPIPKSVNVRADYHIGLLGRADQPDLAQQWIVYLDSDEGRDILTQHGFIVPDSDQ